MSRSIIRGEGRVTTGDVAIQVRYTISIVTVPAHVEGLGSITARLVRLDGQHDFPELLGRGDVVLELDDGRAWGCVLTDMGGAVASRTGITPRPPDP